MKERMGPDIMRADPASDHHEAMTSSLPRVPEATSMIAWDWLRRITATDPPLIEPGMIRVALDPMGRLTSFEAIPPQKDTMPGAASPGWDALFHEASMDSTRFHEVPPTWLAPVDVDQRTGLGLARPVRVTTAPPSHSRRMRRRRVRPLHA
jgi:hypothetical protein